MGFRPKYKKLKMYSHDVNRKTAVQGVGFQTITTFTQVGLPIDLKVTPRITDDGKITTIIDASITSQSGAAPPGGPPPTNVQTATTTLTTKNGETIVIGGLVREVAEDVVNGVLFCQHPYHWHAFSISSKD